MRCAFPELALRVLEALTWVHRSPRPRPAGNFPDLLASIAVVAAAGWLRECARVRGCSCVRLCVCPATGQAGSAVRLLQSPAPHTAARIRKRLTGGCVAPTLVEPPLSIRAPLTHHERQEPTPQAPVERGREPSRCALQRALSPALSGGAERTAPSAPAQGTVATQTPEAFRGIILFFRRPPALHGADTFSPSLGILQGQLLLSAPPELRQRVAYSDFPP